MLCELHVTHIPKNFMALTSSHKQTKNFLQSTRSQQKYPGPAITHIYFGNRVSTPYSIIYR